MINKNPKLRDLLRIAIPMIVSQGSETVMLFVDRLFLSFLGKNFISAAMSGGLTAFAVSSLFIGIVGYVNAITAQYYGAGKYEKCSQTINQGLYLSFGFYPVLLLLIPLIRLFFNSAGHSPQQLQLQLHLIGI